MRKLAVTALGVAALAASGAARGDGDAGDAAAVRATLTCERADGPGRVRCDVEARVVPGSSISWGDVVLTKTPSFASALRGRIGPRDATVHEPDVWRWPLALVARDKGTGDVEGRVRLVVCQGGKCAPRVLDVTGRVVVGEP